MKEFHAPAARGRRTHLTPRRSASSSPITRHCVFDSEAASRPLAVCSQIAQGTRGILTSNALAPAQRKIGILQRFGDLGDELGGLADGGLVENAIEEALGGPTRLLSARTGFT